MSKEAASFQRAKSTTAFLCFLFNRKAYLDMAVSHEMAVNLEASDLRRAFEAGNFPNSAWEAEARLRVADSANELMQGMKSALTSTVVFAALGIALAAMFGKIDPTLPLDYGKFLSVVGGLLAAWATLFELGGYSETIGGEALHEKLRPVFFRAAFLPGLICATAGQLWWQ